MPDEMEAFPSLPAIRTWVAKADGQLVETNTLKDGAEVESTIFGDVGALVPPYPPEVLVKLFEHSNALRQNVDAYATNIDGFGLAYSAVIDLEADDTEDRLRTLIQLEQQDALGITVVKDPTAEALKARALTLADEQRVENLKLQVFFDYCTDESFTKLRKKTRQDREITGNAYWEVLRDAKGKLRKFNFVESHTVRLIALDSTFVSRKVKQRRATQDFEIVEERTRFRRFVQKVGTSVVWFKQFGDPRIMSGATGKFYESFEQMQKGEENKGFLATEMIHFSIFASSSPYGVPRWIGNLLSVMGSRSCEEVNFMYFENKSVPPMAVLVSGGKLAADSVKRLQDYIKNEIRGKDNFHKILVIEAAGESTPGFDDNSGKVKIEIKPLTEAQQSDGQFQTYDERNIDKVGMSFRLPRMLRGDTRDFNRSTAAAALDFAERQVFEPERNEFDDFVNRWIIPDLDIKHWRIKSNGPTQRDPESLAKMIHDLQDVFPVNTLMELAQPVFGRNFARIDAQWAEQPLKLTLAQISTENNAAEGGDKANDANPDNDGGEAGSTTENKSKDKSGQPRQAGGLFGSTGKIGRRKRPVAKGLSAVETLGAFLETVTDVKEKLEEQSVARMEAARADDPAA